MNTNYRELEDLINNATRIIQHQEEIKILKGEHFNIFSILRMETKENATHSAFLGELLNPIGSHKLDTLFLKLFLKCVNYTGQLNLKSTYLKLEEHISTIDYENKTGGRIDLYLADSSGNSICIENKIYAQDQHAQIERYVKHNYSKNTVYYLTLTGTEPEKSSKGTLIEGLDFHCISYKKTIINWLELCQKEVVQQPIIRESLRQYIILIQKLTNTLSDYKMEKEIKDLISNNYLTSKIITDNIINVEQDIVTEFLKEIETSVKNELKNGWNITLDKNLNTKWQGLKAVHESWDTRLQIKLEGQPIISSGKSCIGIIAHINEFDRPKVFDVLSPIYFLNEGYNSSDAWAYWKYIIDLSTTEEKAKLFDPIIRKDMAEKIAILFIELAKACIEPLRSIKSK